MIGRDRDADDKAAVVYSEFKNSLSDYDSPAFVTGSVHDQKSVWQLRGLSDLGTTGSPVEQKYPIIGIYLPDSSEDGIDVGDYGIPQSPPALSGPHVIVTGEKDDLSALEVVQEQGDWSTTPMNVEAVEMDRLFVRVDPEKLDIDGPVPLNELQDKSVAIIGLGSGGAQLATYLAKSGVRNFVFLDNDLYETHNIVRHILGMESLGRKKVNAVQDYLEERIPEINIDAYDRKFELAKQDDIDFFSDLFDELDLIVSASAARTTNQQLNQFVWEQNLDIPVLYAGMFQNLHGGIIIRVDPTKNDPCYHCLYSDLEGEGGREAAEARAEEDSNASEPQFESPRPKQANPNIGYDWELEDEASEPGLGIDVDNLTIFLAKYALSTLLEGTDHNLYEFNGSVQTWGNRPTTIEAFKEEDPEVEHPPLTLLRWGEDELPRRDDCRYCGSN